MRVLVQFRSSPEVHAATLRGEAMPSFAATAEAPIPGLVIDPAFNPVQVPTPRAAEPGASPYLYSPAVSFSLAPEDLGGTGFDHDFGWGVLDGRALVAALAGVKRSRHR